MSNDNVIGIIGSPRPGGNTDALVDEILRGAREAGAATQKFVLEKMDVRPCNVAPKPRDASRTTTCPPSSTP